MATTVLTRILIKMKLKFCKISGREWGRGGGGGAATDARSHSPFTAIDYFNCHHYNIKAAGKLRAYDNNVKWISVLLRQT